MKESHPYVIACYYVAIMTITLFTMNPIILGCSLLGSILFFSLMEEAKKVASTLIYYFFLFILIAITNPLFSHNGETILFFLNDHAITLEAIRYGMAIASMLVAMMFWCKALFEVMTTDKFVYLFAGTLPKISLLLSMSLRFIPLMKLQSKRISQTQKTMGLYASESYADKVMSRIRVFDSVVTWALENGIDTADSMKARGYGLKGRTNFSIFRFGKEDALLLGMIVTLTAGILLGFYNGIFNYGFYPVETKVTWTVKEVIAYAAVLCLAMLPTVNEIKEKIRWKLYV